MQRLALSRRQFVTFLSGTMASSLVGCSGIGRQRKIKKIDPKILSVINPTDVDDLILTKGLDSSVLIGFGDELGQGQSFGVNNDYTAFFPLNSHEAILWVNHEYPFPLIQGGRKRTRENIENEKKSLGGSLVHIKKSVDGKWSVVKNSNYNRRIDATTKIPYASGVKVQGQDHAIGTFANCAGGVTPWGTVLTCEENYHDYYGEVAFGSNDRKPGYLEWSKFGDQHPHHYGWVVEVEPKTGKAKKLTALGRFAHEGATPIKTSNGKVVVYSGDDKAGEFIYKFISDSADSLDKGELFVADLKAGKWLSLDREKNPKLKAKFKDQLDVLIHCREAGRVLGATPCDRPEDIEIHPHTGEVFICLTNNKAVNNFHGSILKISEAGSEHTSLNFKAQDFAVGGPEAGFSCPDNLAFDPNGNLWMTTDISGSAMNKGVYKPFKNNGLFYFPTFGPKAGVAHQFISAPKDAELTGLCFSSDYKTLFLSVQHPGEKSKSLDQLTSTWPNDASGKPRPCVVQINGPLLEHLI